MRPFNFSPGPATLPDEVLEQARDELLDWHGSGASIMEVSHRGKAFSACAAEAEADLRELLQIPDSYRVLFLQGGATAQFAAVPLNLTEPDAIADYLDTGHWSQRACTRRARFCRVNVAADAAASEYCDAAGARELATDARRGLPALHAQRNDRRRRIPLRARSRRRRWSPTCPRRYCRGRSRSAATA